ncbi:MAG: ABC transporter ATP-binding protein [Lachnospiraceae bacterium]|nr:ABC transporter ATP-binding protein [Lachnospiraceae bacterium]
MAVVVCNNLTKRYGKKTALQNINLNLESGRIIGLAGPNGSGKTTMIKLMQRMLVPTEGQVLIQGKEPGPETKAVVAYLPDRDFLPDWMKVSALLGLYQSYYADFDRAAAERMIASLGIDQNQTFKKLSKGTREKVQLILTMSRKAQVYLLDEPIAGVDPAARDYIIRTIISNYNPEAMVLISTHLIADIEAVLDEVIFLKEGRIVLHENADDLRTKVSMSVDEYFREVFRC